MIQMDVADDTRLVLMSILASPHIGMCTPIAQASVKAAAWIEDCSKTRAHKTAGFGCSRDISSQPTGMGAASARNGLLSGRPVSSAMKSSCTGTCPSCPATPVSSATMPQMARESVGQG